MLLLGYPAVGSLQNVNQFGSDVWPAIANIYKYVINTVAVVLLTGTVSITNRNCKYYKPEL